MLQRTKKLVSVHNADKNKIPCLFKNNLCVCIYNIWIYIYTHISIIQGFGHVQVNAKI